MKYPMFSKVLKTVALPAAFLCITNMSQASALAYNTPISAHVIMQDDITDADLQKYAQIQQQINQLREGITEQVVALINEEELDPRVYNELARVDANPAAPRTFDISEEDEAKYERVKAQTAKLQEELNKQATDVVKNSGLPIPKFNTIQKSVANDPDMRARLNQFTEQGTGTGSGTGAPTGGGAGADTTAGTGMGAGNDAAAGTGTSTDVGPGATGGSQMGTDAGTTSPEAGTTGNTVTDTTGTQSGTHNTTPMNNTRKPRK